jgi:hypothetical protein
VIVEVPKIERSHCCTGWRWLGPLALGDLSLPMTAIFISHCSSDNAEAEALKDWLAQQGHEQLFLDFDPSDGVPAGADREQRLDQELRRGHALLTGLMPAWRRMLRERARPRPREGQGGLRRAGPAVRRRPADPNPAGGRRRGSCQRRD